MPLRRRRPTCRPCSTACTRRRSTRRCARSASAMRCAAGRRPHRAGVPGRCWPALHVSGGEMDVQVPTDIVNAGAMRARLRRATSHRVNTHLPLAEGVQQRRQVRGCRPGSNAADGASSGAQSTTASLLHALAVVDVNGDRLRDVVTGKPFWAHGTDGEAAPRTARAGGDGHRDAGLARCPSCWAKSIPPLRPRNCGRLSVGRLQRRHDAAEGERSGRTQPRFAARTGFW